MQSTSVDTFNRRELKAMYEKPYKMLTSSSGKVEGETRDEVNKDLFNGVQPSPIELVRSKMTNQIGENRVKTTSTNGQLG